MIKTRLMKLLKGSEKYIGETIFWQWVSLLFQMAAVWTMGNFLQKLYEGSLDTTMIGITILMAAAAVIMRFICEKAAAYASYKASSDVKQIIRRKIYQKLLRFGASYKEKIPTSEIVQVSTEGVEQLEIYYGKYLPQFFYSLIAPATLFLALSQISMKASVVLLICVPLIPISIVAVQKFAKKLLGKYWGIYTELGDSFLENLQGLTTLKIYQADEKKAEEMDKESERFRKITMKVLTMQLNSVSVMDLVAYGGAAAGMIVTVREYIAGNVEMAGAITIILLASEFFIPLRLLGSFFHIAMNGMAASDKIFRILDLKEEDRGGKTIDDSAVGIEIEDVSFAYKKERQILDHISLQIPSGKFISLTGVSGCGKSTVTSLITGRCRGFSGKIKVNKVPIDEISEKSLMKKITLVRHNSYLFKGTVEENLRLAKEDASEEEMEAVLKKVNLYAFLETQSGLKTVLEEQGNNLSGGQRQRLAIARALLSDSPMYIFDEAASNIDVESEQKIMEVIRELARTKTVLFISHRLENAKYADCIYMMEHGKIVESGTHEMLIKLDGNYAKMYANQQKSCEQKREIQIGETVRK